MHKIDFHLADIIFDEFLSKENLLGTTYALTLDGKVIHQKNFGFTDSTKKIAITADTKFRIASMTKSFAAVAVKKLRDQKLLSFEQTVAEILPELPLDDSVKNLNIFELLSMRSKLLTDDPWADRHMGISNQDFDSLANQIACSPEIKPTEYSYSNFSYMLLGKIIAQVSNQPAMDYISKEILQPLKMTNTVWNRTKPCADGAVFRNRNWYGEPDVKCISDTTVFAGLWSTTEDLAIWLQFLSLPENDVLSFGFSIRPSQQIKLFDLEETQLETATYGFGLISTQLMNNNYIAHSGGLPGYGSHMRFERSTNLGIVCLANSTYAPMSRLGTTILDALIRKGKSTSRTPSQKIKDLTRNLIEFINNPTPELETQIFSHNIKPDYPMEQLRIDLTNLSIEFETRITYGKLICTTHGSFQFDLLGKNKKRQINFSCSPEITPRIQTLKLI